MPLDARTAKRHQFLKKRSAPLTFGFAAAADFSSFIGQEYVAGIMQATSDYGVHFINMATAVRHSLLSDTQFLPQFKTKTQFMRAPLLDGLVTWASSLSEYMAGEEIQALFASLAPLPMVDIGYLDIPDVPSIRIDNAHSMHVLVDHLTRVHGFSRIAFMGYKASHPHTDRLACFLSEMQAAGLPCHGQQIFMADSLNAAAVSAQVEKLLAGVAENDAMFPQAIVTSSDIIAANLIEELEKHGYSVPDDVAVTGFNNQLAGITSSAPITTVDLAYFRRGYEAVELLIDRIMSPQERMQNRRVLTSLVVRQSCGCFEHAILDALKTIVPAHVPAQTASTATVRRYLQRQVASVFPDEPPDSIRSLTEAILSDLYDTNVTPPPKILVWFRTLLKKRHGATSHAYEQQISAVRRIVLPLAHGQAEKRARLETIFHGVRVLYTASVHYDLIAQRKNAAANMTNLALSLASVETLKQLENVLRFKLSEFAIPGAIVALSPYLSPWLNTATVHIVIPDLPDDVAKVLPYKVREPQVLPKVLLPRGKQFSAVLELLFYNGSYIGYAYLFAGSENLALYDDVKDLFSQALYKLYLKEGKTRPHALVVTNRAQLAEAIPITAPEKMPKPGKLQAQEIVDYLIDHLDEMCDLDKMAASLQMSKSHLTRRVKALTGYSVQTLLELLKIEQAKDLIKSGTMRMNDIAARLGYSNPNYFSNVFKKVTGLSPIAWAERNRR